MTTNTINKKIIINNNDHKRYSLIDIGNKDTNVVLEFIIKKHANVDIFVSVLGYDAYKNYKIICHHEDNTSISNVKVFGVAVRKCHISAELLAKIDENTADNNCFQTIKGILLDDDSKIVGKPMLEIDTNLIKAVHSLSIGNINQDYLFYLMAKGLTKAQAIKEIIISYFNITIENDSEQDQNRIISKIEKVLNYEQY